MSPLAGKLVLPSIVEEMRSAQEAVLEAVVRAGYGEHDRFAIQLALEEALANAIHHGNQNDPTRQVIIEFAVNDETVSISVTDEGPGFTPETLPDPTTDENVQKPYGRGVMLMRVYMSEVRYNPTGNRVSMIKRRSSHPGHSNPLPNP